MNLRRVLLLACLLSVPGLSADARAGDSRPDRPNFILVLADDLGVGDLACYTPSSAIPTPRIDRMAAEGIRFTDAHSPASVCTPTRYAIQTGRYGWRTRLQHGVLSLFDAPLIDPERVTLPELLQEADYATGAFGKWHLGLDFAAPDGGIARMVGDELPDVDLDAPVMGGPLEHGYDTYFGAQQQLIAAFLEDRRILGQPRRMVTGLGYRVWKWSEADRGPQQWARVRSFIEDHAGEGVPFFVYYAVPYPHTPYAPADSLAGVPVAGTSGVDARADLVVELDVTMGAIAELLDELGLARTTCVILASDNGGTRNRFTDHDAPPHDPAGGYRGRKGEIWEAGHRIPLIVRWGDGTEEGSVVPPGRVSDRLVGLQDLYATLAEAAGRSIPEGEAEDSESFLPVLLGEDEAPRSPLVLHAVSGRFALRDGPWKLVMPEPGEAGAPQLFHLGEDPTETTDRAAEQPERVARLVRELDDRRAGTPAEHAETVRRADAGSPAASSGDREGE